MSILFKKQPRKFKEAGKFDNITYLMNKGDKDTQKTPEQMQAVADKMNEQARKLGIKTKTVVWPAGKPFNAAGLDYNDDVVMIGDNIEQMKYLKKSNLPDKSASYAFDGFNMGLGVSPGAYRDFGIFNPSTWGAVRTEGARNFARSTGVSEEEALAYLANHERGHNFSSIYPSLEGHAIKPGLMTGGQSTMKNIQKGYSLQDLLNPELPANKKYVEDIIAYRQFGDKDRPAKDNYDENIRRGKFRRIHDGEVQGMSLYDRLSDKHSAADKLAKMKPFIPETEEEKMINDEKKLQARKLVQSIRNPVSEAPGNRPQWTFQTNN